MLKTIGLFLLTNLAVMITAEIIFGLLGVGNYITPGGLDYGSLMVFCLVWGSLFSIISLLMSKFTAKWMMGVQTITPESQGDLGWVAGKVHELARAANLPSMPEVGVYQSDELNAFATGPSKANSLVAVSTGLLQRMQREEIEGVLAHEITHINNGDMVRMTLVQGIVNAFVMFFARIAAYAVAQVAKEEQQYLIMFLVRIVFEIAFGILGSMVVAWFSRQREFRADHGGSVLAGRGKMISALQGLERFYEKHEIDNSAPALASMKIAGKTSGFMALFATHPPLEVRIAALQNMAG